MARGSGSSASAFVLIAAISGFVDADASEVPGWPIQKAELVLADRVGERVFRDDLVFAADESIYEPGISDCAECVDYVRKPHFYLRWRFRVADKPFVDEIVQVAVDANGEILAGPDGLPNCKRSPSLCKFVVDETDAIRIARDGGLEPGNGPWETSFHYFAGKLQRFVWTVSNTLTKRDNGREHGKEVVIDASNGEMCFILDWNKM